MLRVLHLSDLHFGRLPDGSSAHRFVDEHRAPKPETLVGILERDLEERPDVVIISGDVGWSGTKDDYIWAHSFVQLIRKQWNDVPLVITPGNHDVDRKRYGAGRQEAFVSFLRQVHGARFDEQYPLLKVNPSDRRMMVAFQRITNKNGDDLFIVAVNSAAYLEDKGEPVGFATNDLQAIEQHLKHEKLGKTTLRLFVLHHALFPFAEPPWTSTIDVSALNEKPDLSIVANSATLQGWLAENDFQIVLHGHKHSMQGRQDILWRKNDAASGRRLFVLGAGSTGVEHGHLAHNEPLSFNLLEISRLSLARWWVNVSVCEVLDQPTKSKRALAFGTEVGQPLEGAPLVFHAEDMVDCHRAIFLECEKNRLKYGKNPVLRNFTSVVENCEFKIPPTARFQGKEVTQAQIDGTFQALHPEYTPTNEWKDLTRLDSTLHAVSPRLQFQHGPRMFGRPHGMTQSPIEMALSQLGKDLGSDAYASLFQPEVDIPRVKDDLTPHLMSIQFIPDGGDGGYLDAVVTFRKIELSYWWVANMYEIGKLLQWAAKYKSGKRRTARRITFFAGLVEWKDKPEAAFVTRLDRMRLEELASLVARVCQDDATRSELVDLLEEKLEHTNERNLDAKGLDDLRAIFSGLLSTRPSKPPPPGFIEKLAAATRHIHDAVEKEPVRETEDARKELAEAIRLLRESTVTT